jgi:hypothetical protein
MRLTSTRQALSSVALGLALLASAYPSAARVTKIMIDETLPSASNSAYEEVAGRAFGELDPNVKQNAIIQDIKLGLDKDGKAHYVASFVIRKPKDMSRASGLMWHEVPNRGNVYATAPEEFAFGDIMLASAWQQRLDNRATHGQCGWQAVFAIAGRERSERETSHWPRDGAHRESLGRRLARTMDTK